jgi:hypothetical protein
MAECPRLTDSDSFDTASSQNFQDLPNTITSKNLLVRNIFTVGRPYRSDTNVIGSVLDCVLGFLDGRD